MRKPYPTQSRLNKRLAARTDLETLRAERDRYGAIGVVWSREGECGDGGLPCGVCPDCAAAWDRVRRDWHLPTCRFAPDGR